MLNEIINGENIEKRLLVILKRIHSNGPIRDADFELLSYIKKFHSHVFKKYESELLYLMGLFYKVTTPSNMIEQVYSIYADCIKKETGNQFTPVQADAYKQINKKEFFSFSAPTSTGKSYLFRELILNTKGDVVIVVPSRALIAEYISAVLKLVDKTVLVLQFIENVNIAKIKRRIFVITPERSNELFKHLKDFNVQLVLLDEAQISEEEVRGMKFDSFVRRISKESPLATKVFAHPFVANPEAQLKKHKFNVNSTSALYEQSAVGKIFVSSNKNTLFYFSPYSDDQKERIPVKGKILEDILTNSGTILVYSAKSKLYDGSYLNEYKKLLRLCPLLKVAGALKYIEKLRDYIGAGNEGSKKESLLIRLMNHGIVIHHGSMPLKARLIIEEFVRANYARICFCTSTLKQGINMPFDAVIIDNFRGMDILTLKNLIGRAGRTTGELNSFDYGYAIIPSRNVKTFSKRMKEAYCLQETSNLDNDITTIPEDQQDIVEAIKNNTFDDELRLTDLQVQRLDSEDIYTDIVYILDNLLLHDRPLTGNDYYNLADSKRDKIKTSFKKIFIKHLRRPQLTKAEMGILSTSIPILLWHIQGKSFKEVMALRYYFLSKQKEQNRFNALVREGKMSKEQAEAKIEKLIIRYSPAPQSLPDKSAKDISSFRNISVTKLDYDLLVYDTYDYIDKVISLSLSEPLCAAFLLYYRKSKDKRALSMSNYIRYGTNDHQEIWLLKYGFTFEDIEWVKIYVKSIDQKRIVFKKDLSKLTTEQFQVIERYL